MASAHLDDSTTMARFLAAIPNGDRLAEVLAGHVTVSSRAYDDDTGTARFVASNGTTVKCFTVSDITIDQAEMIAFFEADMTGFDEAAFRNLVVRALGPTFDPPAIAST